MNIQLMRAELAKAYSGDRWKKKVLAMTDNQVVAVYRRLQSEGKL